MVPASSESCTAIPLPTSRRRSDRDAFLVAHKHGHGKRPSAAMVTESIFRAARTRGTGPARWMRLHRQWSPLTARRTGCRRFGPTATSPTTTALCELKRELHACIALTLTTAPQARFCPVSFRSLTNQRSRRRREKGSRSRREKRETQTPKKPEVSN